MIKKSASPQVLKVGETPRILCAHFSVRHLKGGRELVVVDISKFG